MGPAPDRRPIVVGPIVVGIALAGLYLVTAGLTLVLSDRPFRPLFDGLAPPVPYRWVNPPREVARDNRQPVAASREFPLRTDGSPFVNVTPDDGQVILLLEETAVPPHPPDTAVAVTVTPFDALTLGPLPEDMSPQSNAYRVEIEYRPSGQPVTEFDGGTSSIDLIGAGGTDALLYSADGRSWAPRDTTPLGAGHGLETLFAGTGYYVVAAIDESTGQGGTSPILVGLFLLAPPLLVGGLMLRRRVARTRAEAQAVDAARRRAQQPRGGRKSKRRRR